MTTTLATRTPRTPHARRTPGSRRAGVAPMLLLPAALLAVACSDRHASLEPVLGDAQLSVFVELGAAPVGQLGVEVSAPDIGTLYFNLSILDGFAAGTITLRAGAARTVTLRAFDHAGRETHRGSTTIDVVEGANPAVQIVLAPLGEGDPMDGIVGEYALLPITADDWPFDPVWNAYLGHRQATLQLFAYVVGPGGDTMAVPIHWAGPGVNALGVASAPPWTTGAATMIATVTAIAGTQARQVRVAFQDWGSVEPATLLSARFGRTCGLNDEGEAFCWGSSVLAPVRVETGQRFTTLAAGDSHTCAVAMDGSVWCWGSGLNGQLGDGNMTGSLVPVRVASDETFIAVGTGSAQSQHTCALTDAGEAWCWGNGGLGQLGNGTFDNSPVPVRADSEEVFRSLTVGFAHACAITVNDDAYCWGNNFNGKVGNGTTTNQNTPQPVAGELKFASISVSTQVSCGLTTADELYCWGGAAVWYPGGTVPVLVSIAETFVQLRVGGAADHHICGWTAAGVAYCWGANAAGQLGDGTNDNATTPVQVAGGLIVQQIAPGGDFTCAVTTEQHVYCWGGNASGQLGDLSRNPSNVPVRVASPVP